VEPSYVDLVGRTVSEGLKIQSRYGMTFERRNVTVAAMAGEWPRRPMLNPRIGFMEGLFLVGCFFDLGRIIAVAPKADHSLFTVNGAYGPRVRSQIHRLVQMMADSPESRQHILYIGAAGDQYKPDTPCTNSMQFLARQGYINCIVNMRSSDIVKGLPTDMIQFGLLAQVLAICLGLVPGVIAINAASSHLYQLDMDKVPSGADDRGTRRFVVPTLPGLEGLSPNARLSKYQDWAVSEAYGTPWQGDGPVEVVREATAE
jgi:hypothetical protein